MDTAINLTSVYVSDLIGVAILLIILLTRGWDLPARKDESRILLALVSVSILNCIADLIVFRFDGMPGMFNYCLLLTDNAYLYLYNVIIGVGTFYLIIKHISHSSKGAYMVIFWIICVLEVVLLITNFFVPILFSIDDNNMYQRERFYFLFVVLGFVLIIYAYAYYILNKIQNPSLRYFPVVQFLFPVLLGNVIQMNYYGISLQPVSFAVALAAVSISLQHECLYIDKLTGVYNRYELDRVLQKRFMNNKIRVLAMMLDLNDFKAINDNYSHDEGDNALIAFAKILQDSVANEGTVIRFAGDEFIVLVHKYKDMDPKLYANRIRARINTYNEKSDKPYKLSTSIGGKVFDPSQDDYKDLLTQIDHLMYADKREFYKKHDRRGRRNSDKA